MVLDEPFSGLDPLAVDVMSAVLREQADAGIPVIYSSHELELVERLCDRVGIIDRGTMVACGTVDELRAGRRERRWVDLPGAPTGWDPQIPGARLVQTVGSRSQFELDPGVDDQALLQAALATGPVREFEPVEPSLGELFRAVIEEPRREPTRSEPAGHRPRRPPRDRAALAAGDLATPRG